MCYNVLQIRGETGALRRIIVYNTVLARLDSKASSTAIHSFRSRLDCSSSYFLYAEIDFL